jgi:hypothetical protein
MNIFLNKFDQKSNKFAKKIIIYFPSGFYFGINEYFNPEGNPAPPLPLRPDFLISSIIQSIIKVIIF